MGAAPGALLLALFLLSGPVLAAPAGEYTLDALSMELTVPELEGCYVFLPDTAAQDPDAAVLGLDGAALAQLMTQQKAYLNVIREDLAWELGVVMDDGEDYADIHDFGLFEEEFFDPLVTEMSTSYAGMGITLSDYTLWDSGQARYLILSSSQVQDGREICRRQYYTIFNGQAINFTLVSYDGPPDEEAHQFQQDLVESVRFTQTVPAPAEARTNAAQVRRELGGGSPWSRLLPAILAGTLAGGITGLLLQRKRKLAQAPADLPAPEVPEEKEDTLP